MSEHKNGSQTKFRLFEDAEKAGVFTSDGGWLIAAPTSTGKSYIGIEAIKRQLPTKPAMECYVYLVPFKALAEEMYTKIKQAVPTETRIHIKTGDYDRPFQPTETDVLVATYESLDGMIQEGVDFYPSLIVADEFSILTDQTRGARIESLIAFLAKYREGTKLLALSAVLSKPEEISNWLGLKLLKGTERHRPVPLDIKPVEYYDKLDTVKRLLREGLDHGTFIIFCFRREWTESLCDSVKDIIVKKLTPVQLDACKQEAKRLKDDFAYLVKLPELVANGVAYHHADLELAVRNRVAELFTNKVVRVVAATTTLGAGVNTPARYVIVKDITQIQELLPVSVMLNMLGRAGRSPFDDTGVGYFLVDRRKATTKKYKEFIDKVTKREVEPIESKIPKSMSNMLGFILSTAARMKGVTRDDLATVFNTTLAGQKDPLEIPLPSKEALLENVGKLVQHPRKPTQLDEGTLRIVSGTVLIKGGSGGYQLAVSETQSTCTCPAWVNYNPKIDCKHLQQLKYEAIVGQLGEKHPEVRAIALAAFKEEGLAHRPMYMISTGLDLLTEWDFLVEKEGKLYITNDGRQALVSYKLPMEHVRMLRDRISRSPEAKNEVDVIRWAIEDFRIPNLSAKEEGDKSSEISNNGRLERELEDALWKYIQNVPYKQVVNQSNVVKFLDAKETLEQIFSSYLAFTPSEKRELSRFIRIARNRVHYGCTRELIPLMILELASVRDSTVAFKLGSNGIDDVFKLASIDSEFFSHLTGIGPDESRLTLEQAKSVVKLVLEFKGVRTDLNRLAAQTGVKIDDLLDYLLPPAIAEQLRK